MCDYSRSDERALSEMLDRDWDPIGIYQGAAAEQARSGEYSTYAGWIYHALLAGGGKREVIDRMRDARDRMGIARARRRDDRAAELIVAWWNQRTNH